MKKTTMRIAAMLAAVAMAASAAHAQFKVATGNLEKGSTYAKMHEEMTKACPANGTVQVQTNGTLDNFDKLTQNEVNGAWVQADVLFYARHTDPDRVSNLRTIVGLHREALHFVARGEVKSGGVNLGVVRLGGETKILKDLGDARKMKIGAVGGSFETAKIVNNVAGLGMQVVRYTDNGKLLDALRTGEINVALFVGGINFVPVQQLSREFRLLSVPEDVVKASANVYSTMTVSYRNLEQSGVRTLNTQAILVTQNYGSAKMKTAIAKIRECFDENAEDIADATGTSPAWRDVKRGQNGNWPMYGQ